jgi:hypothetical protein
MLIADARGHRFHRYFESINDEAGVEAGDRAGSYTPLHRFGWPQGGPRILLLMRVRAACATGILFPIVISDFQL